MKEMYRLIELEQLFPADLNDYLVFILSRSVVLRSIFYFSFFYNINCYLSACLCVLRVNHLGAFRISSLRKKNWIRFLNFFWKDAVYVSTVFVFGKDSDSIYDREMLVSLGTYINFFSHICYFTNFFGSVWLRKVAFLSVIEKSSICVCDREK